MTESPFTATVLQLPSQQTVCVRITATKSSLGETFGKYAHVVFAAVAAAGATPAGPLYGRYFTFSDETVDVEIGIPVTAAPAGLPSVGAVGAGEVGAGELPATRAAVTEHYGPYHQLPDTYRRLQAWITSQGWALGDAPWESYVDDPGDMTAMSGVRTDVSWPVG